MDVLLLSVADKGHLDDVPYLRLGLQVNDEFLGTNHWLVIDGRDDVATQRDANVAQSYNLVAPPGCLTGRRELRARNVVPISAKTATRTPIWDLSYLCTF